MENHHDRHDQAIADGLKGVVARKPGRPKGKPKTGGRKKGTPNKITKDVKAAVLAAFEMAGGENYLLTVAKTDPKTFCALLGKAMPMQVAGDPDNPLRLHTKLEFAIVDPNPQG